MPSTLVVRVDRFSASAAALGSSLSGSAAFGSLGGSDICVQEIRVRSERRLPPTEGISKARCLYKPSRAEPAFLQGHQFSSFWAVPKAARACSSHEGVGLGPSRTVCGQGRRLASYASLQTESYYLMTGVGFAFVAHGYLEPSPAVPGERERSLRSRRKTLIV